MKMAVIFNRKDTFCKEKNNLKYRLCSLMLCLYLLCRCSTIALVHAEDSLEPYQDTVLTETCNLEEFSKEVFELYEDYVLDSSFEDQDFQTCRLLVNAAIPIEDSQACEIISGYGDYYVIQYESAEKAKEAYCRLKEEEGVAFVQPDRMLNLEPVIEAIETVQGRTVRMQEADLPAALETALTPRLAGFQKEDAYSWVDISNEKKKDFLSWNSSKIGIDQFCSFITSHYSYLPVIKVAVLDTGIDDSLDIFKGRILPGGKNYTSVSLREQYADDHGHGTMVSSVIADNSFSNVRILPIKVMDRNGRGYDSQIVFGMAYAMDYGVDIINMSLGAKDAAEYYMQIVDQAAEREIALVAAAGNDGKNVEMYSPANIESAITISSTGSSDQLSRFSNYGNTIDFAVPGENITVIARNGIIREISGTSFSAPCASAAFALLKSVDVRQNRNEIYSLLKEYAVDLGTKGWDTSFGHGRMNLSGLEPLYKNGAYVTYNLEPGSYEGSASITFTSSRKDMKIYYTTDGTDPSPAQGKLYEGKIRLEKTTVLKAAGYLAEERVTENFSGTYYIHFGMLGNYQMGDVDLDGRITSGDAYIVLQFIVGRESLNDLQRELADADGDGKVTAVDVWRILQREVLGTDRQ